jgi:MarR family transcriptional regulator, lower aerobic nicotinate degradation pathway regulator
MDSYIDQLISLIFTVRRQSFEHINPRKGKHVSILQSITLRFIKEKNPSMKELADFLSITPPSVTSLIDKLARPKMVMRQKNLNDRRGVRLKITRQGEKYLKRCMQEMEKRMRKNLGTLTKQEQKKLIEILSKIINNN